jgi:putative CocE/NonD family hydrolase
VETRDDVLVYTSEPLPEGVEMTGPVTATVYLSTDVPDTDVSVKLLEVEESGRALNVSHGIARVRYRESFDNPRFLEGDEVVAVEVTLFPTSIYLPAGRRIRIEVSSSNFPLFGRNLNIAGSSDTSSEYQVAHTRIFHEGEHGSRIVLPLIRRPAMQDRP